MKIQFAIFLVIAVLLALTALFAFFSARTEAENRQVILDSIKIKEALDIYKQENGFYPDNREVPVGLAGYISFWPIPATAGKCGSFSEYAYDQKSNGENFGLTFCLTGKTSGLQPGFHTISSGGIQ